MRLRDCFIPQDRRITQEFFKPINNRPIATTPTMLPNPLPYSHFTLTSGGLCYGALHNILHGARSSPQSFPSISVPMNEGGTVLSQKLDHNVIPRTGTWTAYRLMDLELNQVCGWFACHSDVKLEAEVRRILKAAGSPYEPDYGSNFNDAQSHGAAVLVINRYDWDYYDSRCKDECPVDNDEEVVDVHVAAGLCDAAHAQQCLDEWKAKASKDREALPHGVWMHIPDMEYMFGRFGYDENRQGAQSFLLFTANTVFNQTVFEGTKALLRPAES